VIRWFDLLKFNLEVGLLEASGAWEDAFLVEEQDLEEERGQVPSSFLGVGLWERFQLQLLLLAPPSQAELC